MQKDLFKFAVFTCCLTLSCQPPGTYIPSKETGEANQEAPFYTKALPAESPRFSKAYDSARTESYYPFLVYKDGSYMIAAEIESKELLDKYSPVFEGCGYSGNGYSWEGHITQILQKENPSLLKHLYFDPEAGGFYVFADSEKTQREFAELMSKIFKDIPKLVQYLKSANRMQIHD